MSLAAALADRPLLFEEPLTLASSELGHRLIAQRCEFNLGLERRGRVSTRVLTIPCLPYPPYGGHFL
jgi:hypothetical protein